MATKIVRDIMKDIMKDVMKDVIITDKEYSLGVEVQSLLRSRSNLSGRTNRGLSRGKMHTAPTLYFFYQNTLNLWTQEI